jgi:hypothetical protein
MNTAEHASFSPAIRLACWIAFAVAVAANLLVWTHPRGVHLDNGHSFRQFQTALTARYLARDGFRLDYETPVLGAPWSIPMEFPVYQATVAAAVRVTGASLETAGRWTAMAYFWAALPAIWLLLGLWGVARETRWLALALMLTCPLYLFYGRHFMIETTALCLGLWFLWAFARAVREGRKGHAVAAVLLAVAASLAKVTTFFGFGFAAAVVLALELSRRPADRWRLLVQSALLLLPALVLSVWWVRYADGLKAQNPLASFLVSSHLHAFNFGPLSQRVDPGTWWQFYVVTTEKLATGIALALALVGAALLPRTRRRLAGAALLCFVAGLGVFTNLFYVHDYYFEATAVFLVAAIALGLEGLLAHASLPVALRVAVPALVLAAQLAGFWREFGAQFTLPPPGTPPVTTLVNRLTEPDDVIAVVGEDWHARFPYHSDRRGLMVPGGFEQNYAALQQSVALLGSRRIGALIVTGDFRERPQALLTLTRLLQVAPRPSAEGDGAQVYLPKDRLPARVAGVDGREFPLFTLHRDYDPARDLLAAENESDLTQPDWRDKFTMTSPAPARARGLFPVSFAERDGATVIGTHAPHSLYFNPPAGARQLLATGGMFPGAYEGKDYTDGVVIEVWESLPDGRQYLHFQRELLPRARPADRNEFTIDLRLDRPFLGPVYLRVDPGPAGQVNYDWFYWRNIRIH